MIENIMNYGKKVFRIIKRKQNPIAKKMKKQRELFSDWYQKSLELRDFCKIKKLTSCLDSDGLWIIIENGLSFLYVPNFGLRHMEFNQTNDRLELELIFNNLDKNGIFFDIGASYGWYSLNVAKKFPLTKIYSFEPLPKAFFHLQKNIERNSINTIYPYQIAVGNINGPMGITNNSFGGDYLVSDHSNALKINCITLDTFIEDNEFQRVDYIKIDVEGAELFVLLGGKSLIKRFHPILQIETTDDFAQRFNYHSKEVFDFLIETGYDYLFLNPEAQLLGVGKFQPSSGDVVQDLKKSSEFIFFPKDSGINYTYNSIYKTPLPSPYI